MRASYSINPSEGSLTVNSDTMPDKGRIYHTVTQYKGDVYLIGGQPGGKDGTAKSKALKSVYTDNQGLWVQQGILNTARARHATAVYNDMIWVCGGRGGNGFGSLLSCETYDGKLLSLYY